MLNADFFQNSCFKDCNIMVVGKAPHGNNKVYKKQCHMEYEIIIKIKLYQ